MKDWHKMRAWVKCDNQYYYLAEDFSDWLDEDLDPQYAMDDLPKYELEQYIGIKDKNGKLIYEGDIVSHAFKFGGGKGVVEYFAPRFLLTEKDGTCDEILGLEVTGNIEIIGNIHENPDLLT